MTDLAPDDRERFLTNLADMPLEARLARLEEITLHLDPTAASLATALEEQRKAALSRECRGCIHEPHPGRVCGAIETEMHYTAEGPREVNVGTCQCSFGKAIR